MIEAKEPSGCLKIVKVLLIILISGIVFWVTIIVVVSLLFGGSPKTSTSTTPNKNATPRGVVDASNVLDAAGLMEKFNARLDKHKLLEAKSVGLALTSRFPNSPEADSIRQRFAGLDAEIAQQKKELEVRREKSLADAEKARAKARVNAEHARAAADAQRKNMLSGFHKERDEVSGVTFYYASDVPMNRVGNFFGLYMGVPDHGAPFLRWKFMYTADDWLFIERLTLNVDGERKPSIELPYGSVERDNSGEGIWEWHDEALNTSADMAPFVILAASKKVIIRYEGKQYYKDRILSEREKKAMFKVMNAYLVLSGKS